jgi:hypothetical protein
MAERPPGASKLIAIDPGEQVGWATGYVADSQLTVSEHGYMPWKDFAVKFHRTQANAHTRIDYVIYEAFRLRPMNAKALIGSDFPTVKCIGAVMVACWAFGGILITQEPSIKPVIDKWMGGAEAYLPRRQHVEHYRDALRHLHYAVYNPKGHFKLALPKGDS